MEKLEWLRAATLGAIVGATVTIVVGFTQSGWMLESAAERMARQRTDSAVLAALIPVCIAQSRSDPDSTVKVAQFGAMKTSYERRDFVMHAGWATMPAAKHPSGILASACADELLKTARP